MKPFNELTRLGRIRRMRQLATIALSDYGVYKAHLQFVRQAGNTLFRVWTSNLPGPKEQNELFEEGQFLLRVHEPGYQEPEAIDLELTWLTAMRRGANLPVPEPIPTLDGKWLLSINLPGVPGTRKVLFCAGSKGAQ